MKALYVKSKFGLGRDFDVYSDENYQDLIYKVDGKVTFGLKAELKDKNENVLVVAKAPWFNIPRKMRFFDAEGSQLAMVRAHISPIRARLTMELTNGTVWKLAGNMVGKSYTVNDGTKDIIVIDQKWVTVRDKYRVDIDENADEALALGLVWAVDAWREGKGT